MDYEMVYLPKNRFIKEEQLHTEQFLLNFFPFEKPHLMKAGKSYAWSVSGDNRLMALSATFSDYPLSVTLSFMPEYKYYRDNPALSINEAVKQILAECGVL